MKIKHGNTLTEEKNNRKRTEITKKIEMNKWKAYFMQLLEGTETPEHINDEINETPETEENEDKITGAEIRRQIAKLKKKKAPGEEDGLENEVWINGNRKVI